MQQFDLAANETISFPGLDELFLDDDSAVFDTPKQEGIKTAWAAVKLGTLQARLDLLHPRGSGVKFQLSNNKVMNVANEIFGFEGWSTRLLNVTIDEVKVENERYTIIASSTVQLVLKDGTTYTTYGTGRAQNLPEKGRAFRTAKMMSVTSAVKKSIMEVSTLVDL